MKIILTTIPLLFVYSICLAQLPGGEGWKMVENSDGMKIFTRLPEDSRYKEIKMDVLVDATVDNIVKFISIASKFPEWIYTCSEAYSIDMESGLDIYYIRFDMTWPICDRDIVQFSNTVKNHKTGVVDIETKAIEGKIPEQDGAIRVKENHIIWKLTPLKNNKTRLQYYAMNDPGGIVPAWLMNMVVTVGPKKTMKNLLSNVENHQW